MKDKIKIFQATISLLAILIVIGMGIISFRISNTKKRFEDSNAIEQSEVLKARTSNIPEIEIPEVRRPKPSRPEDLGLTVYYEDNKPKTQEEWNTFVAESYRKNREEFEKGGYEEKLGANLYKQLDNASLEEIETNRVNIDKKLSECEEKLKTNPDDEDAKKQLENWRTLKALLTAVYGEKSNIGK